MTTRVLALAAFLIRLALAQEIHGTLRDAAGRNLADAIVTLQPAGEPPLASRTDASGTYRLPALHTGSYSVRAQAPGYAALTYGPFALATNESKTLDLTLKPLEAEFFDAPDFIVAGVTDTTNHGGHGSDTLLRSTEALARETASLGDVREKQNALDAVREYQRLAELEPTEPHLFDWASELLTHRAATQAIEVFTKGDRLFPASTRMLLGTAVAWYTNGSDDNASHYFFAACDLNPSDPTPYQFLGKVQSAGILESDGYLERLERFAELAPGSALANYYYAASLWKHRAGQDDVSTSARVEQLLSKAVQLDPHLGAAYLLLGILYSDRGDSRRAIAAFLQSSVDEAHYRLSQEYRKRGDTQNAEKEIAVYNELSRKSADQAQRERLEIQQFVFSLRERK